jgi:hypothetical protein
VVRNDCAERGPANPRNYIELLEVTLRSQRVRATWTNGHVDTWPCSPHPRNTPVGADRVGLKCSVNHTNLRRDGMAWFTGFRSTGYRIGFHNSQRVGPGIHSHGCVRVRCNVAQIINQNTWSRRTRIVVR